MNSPSYRVLLLGSSGMVFSDTGPSGTLSSLLAAELASRLPGVDCMCEGQEIPPTRDMVHGVAAAIERFNPSAVVLGVSASYFTYDYVLARVRRRWPRLHTLARRLTEEVKDLAGGGMTGVASIRGELFRAPRRLASRFIGAEAYMTVDHAIANTLAAIDYLAARDGLLVVFKLPTMNTQLQPGEVSRYRPRLDRFNEAVEAACRERGIRPYDVQAELTAAGKVEVRVSDGLHGDLDTRRWEASFLAGILLDRLDPRTLKADPSV